MYPSRHLHEPARTAPCSGSPGPPPPTRAAAGSGSDRSSRPSSGSARFARSRSPTGHSSVRVRSSSARRARSCKACSGTRPAARSSRRRRSTPSTSTAPTCARSRSASGATSCASAAARRRETRLVEEQLATFGASRVQIAAARATEALVPSLVGLALALGGLFTADRIVGQRALRLGTVLTIVAVTAVAALLLGEAGRPLRSRRGIGGLELAALAALGVVVWQTATTGALDPGRIANGDRASPVLLLVPALAFFATAVLLLRALPWGLRLAERAARRAPFGTRLALLGAARRPGQAAAATTFLPVALGASLFSLDYRATLDRHARDEADFAVGASWRATGGDVAPLTRLVGAASEPPTPALRLDAGVPPVLPSAAELPVQLVAVPAARLGDLRGWRQAFSGLSRAEIAQRLRPRPVRLSGPAIAADATALRVWARADTDR